MKDPDAVLKVEQPEAASFKDAPRQENPPYSWPESLCIEMSKQVDSCGFIGYSVCVYAMERL